MICYICDISVYVYILCLKASKRSISSHFSLPSRHRQFRDAPRAWPRGSRPEAKFFNGGKPFVDDARSEAKNL